MHVIVLFIMQFLTIATLQNNHLLKGEENTLYSTLSMNF